MRLNIFRDLWLHSTSKQLTARVTPAWGGNFTNLKIVKRRLLSRPKPWLRTQTWCIHWTKSLITPKLTGKVSNYPHPRSCFRISHLRTLHSQQHPSNQGRLLCLTTKNTKQLTGRRSSKWWGTHHPVANYSSLTETASKRSVTFLISRRQIRSSSIHLISKPTNKMGLWKPTKKANAYPLGKLLKNSREANSKSITFWILRQGSRQLGRNHGLEICKSAKTLSPRKLQLR